jgi:predicted metal-binding protein
MLAPSNVQRLSLHTHYVCRSCSTQQQRQRETYPCPSQLGADDCIGLLQMPYVRLGKSGLKVSKLILSVPYTLALT